MWIDEYPIGSHGYSVIDENHTCDWLSQYELIDDPDFISVSAISKACSPVSG